MLILLRSICSSACFVSGVYYSFLIYKDRDYRRDVWFPILCFISGLNLTFRLACNPSLLWNPSFEWGIRDNLFLVTFALTSLAMNLYNGLAFNKKNRIFFVTYNYCCVFISMICFATPPETAPFVYIVCLFLALISFIYGIYSSYQMYLSDSKTYLYSLVAFALLIPAVSADIIIFITQARYLSIRLVFVPAFFILINRMMSAQFNESLEKTQALATSLAETIEKINHSNNAIQCTQMKPDFLYRTLDLISDRCLTDSFAAEDMTIALSKYLRHTLNFQQLKGVVHLANELELIRAYRTIETERNKNVTIDINIPEEVPLVYVPPLSIQPLIENAIEHGMKDSETPLRITISVIHYKEYCHIDVSDNGKGISEEMLSGLPASFAQTARIGLYNIDKRLTSKFETGLVIQSAEGVGTSISFTVPPEGKYEPEEGEVIA